MALQFKQIANKFRQLLEILIGPQTTRIANSDIDVGVNAPNFTVSDASELPDVGTLIWDEGLASEETIEYCFVDRKSNTVTLNGVTEFEHQSAPQDAESIMLGAQVGDTEIQVSNPQAFPSSDYPYTLVLGRGTPEEEVVQLLGVDLATKVLTVSPLANTHPDPLPQLISSDITVDYGVGSYILQVSSINSFPDTGTVLLGDSATTFTVVSATSTSITVAPSTFEPGTLIGYKVALVGILGDAERYIQSNTADTLTLTQPLPGTPSFGVPFRIRPVVEYTSRDTESESPSLNIRRAIPTVVAPTAGTQVEVLDTYRTAALAGIKVQGRDWDLIDNGSGLLEVLVPDIEDEKFRLIDAAYFHAEEESPSPTATTLATTVITTDSVDLLVDSTIGFPEAGVLQLPAENIGFAAKEPTFTTAEVLTGASSITVENSFVLPGPGGVIDLDIQRTSPETVTVVTNDTATGIVTFAPALASDHLEGATVRYAAFTIPHGHTVSTPASTVISLFQPVYAGTDLVTGGDPSVIDLFQGPYVFKDDEYIIGSVGNTELDEIVSGPTRLAMTLSPETGLKTAVEVENGNLLPLDSAFELTIDSEDMTATEVGLIQRCLSGFAFSISSGFTNITTDTGTLRPVSADPGGKFPDATGYRVRLSPNTPREEVAFVTGISGDVLQLESPTTINHFSTDTIELYSDTITVQQIDLPHTGVNDYSDRALSGVGVLRPRPFTINDDVDVARVIPKYNTLTVADGSVLDSTGGTIAISWGLGNRRVETRLAIADAPGNNFLDCVDTSEFPIFPDYPYFVVVGEGEAVEETVIIDGNSTILNRLIIDTAIEPGDLRFTHPVGTRVRLINGDTEIIPYDSVLGDVISFSEPIMLQSNHQTGEKVSLVTGFSDPSEFGTDFPLRMPPNLLQRVELLFDLIRAAGVEVRFINKR